MQATSHVVPALTTHYFCHLCGAFDATNTIRTHVCATNSVVPGSAFDISGNLNVTISAPGLSSSGFGNVVEQGTGSGSLHSNLSGLLNANISTSSITFVGGNTFTALPSGNWQPSGLPALFGFQVEVTIRLFPGLTDGCRLLRGS